MIKIAKDPICGMQVDRKTAEFTALKDGRKYYFCSKYCMVKFQKSNIIPIIIGSSLVIFSVLSYLLGYMRQFMGIFFIIFSVLKMPDWKGFVNAFSMYDIIAKLSRIYAWLYPAIEFCLGICFLLGIFIMPALIFTVVIMSTSSIGVAKNLFSKNPARCACIGTLFNVPLTKVTLLEDILMLIMAADLLLHII